jgi:transcription initiation factor IIE alpha subunit
MSRNDLINYFNRNVKAARIRAALMQLHRDGLATCEKVKRDGPGAPEERWYASVPE